MVKINGREEAADGLTISQYIAENGYDSGRMAIEINGDILPKSQYAGTTLHDGDCVEIVSFVGGG